MKLLDMALLLLCNVWNQFQVLVVKKRMWCNNNSYTDKGPL